MYREMNDKKTYLLIHGAFQGGWCWTDVAEDLRALGHAVFTPTWTGLGERSHLLSSEVTLETFIEDVAQVLRYEQLNEVFLVGHSFSGSVVSSLADRMPERFRHLVYLDANLLQNGESPAERSPDLVAVYADRARKFNDGLSIPPSAPDRYGFDDPHAAARIAARLTPHPLRTYYDKLRLSNPIGNGLPVTYIACNRPYFPTTAPAREFARSATHWEYVEIPTSHNAMLHLPHELARLLSCIGSAASCARRIFC